ncbi:MAG: bifunctional (p)ppGpp synthetase/guanosine-3',5'-bis(diphosphate) 3'-pyrophosphohydrolase [Deltaproteobacteria bacterium]|nr:bifunctional (p)ppGpp synthetase/guanosine-3',5'-bis(diphosphate) 3'-pyrophosphohydrolase [Deltaproteobacteria bacterium]
MEPGIDNLVERINGYLPHGTPLDRLEEAYRYSAELRKKQQSTSHAPLEHALNVSRLLADMRLDLDCVIAGLFHDVLEDSLTSAAELRNRVGEKVSNLVEEVSKLSRASFHGTETSRAEHMRQMILASTRDLRVILILLANRLQYLREAHMLTEETAHFMARETHAIYAPIAHRLGIHFIKAELEDRAFMLLEPEEYANLRTRVENNISERSARIEEINQAVKELLAREDITAEVVGRTKHIYSIYNKMKRARLDLDKIYDVLATRIIVDSQEECYRVLGLVHSTYTPLPGRFKDYIALPKANGYQSLHTLVFSPSGNLFEIQIRTRKMHDMAEMGIAAHFIYKGEGSSDKVEQASVNWFRMLLENLEQGLDSRESLELLTMDLTPENLFVFTPKGEVIKLPQGATPIDFAYAVHTEVGNKCVGAKCDGRMISIRTPLKDGSVVEIVTQANQEPKEDWLKYAKSSKAQGRIRSFLRRKERSEAIGVGRDMLAREARRAGMKMEELLQTEPFLEWMKRHNISTHEELFAAEGFGRIHLGDVLERLFHHGSNGETAAQPQTAPSPPPKKTKPKSLVIIDGLDNMMIRFAKCCSPVHGDPLAGIITRGHGVSIHHRDCKNLSQQIFSKERLIEAEWQDEHRKNRPVTLAISSSNSMKELLSLITMLEDDEGMKISSGRISSRQGMYTQHLTLMAKDSRQLEKVLQRLNAMEGIRAERVLESA